MSSDPGFDFDFTEEQRALADVSRDLFAEACPPERLRERWQDGAGPDDTLWFRMAQVGILGLTAPEEQGGAGGDETDLELVLEAAGYAAVPDPLLETVGVAVPALVEAGGPLAAEWLPRVVAGDALLTTHVTGAGGVHDADRAAALIAVEGGRLFLAGRAAYEVVDRGPAEDRLRRLFTVEVGPDRRPLGADPVRAYDRAAFGTAALLVGVGRRLLDRSVEHATQRHQFGRPIGSFQAVSHKLASCWIDLEAAHSATRYAAYALANGLDDRSVAVAAAKVAANDAQARANTDALQVHGGIGFTWEHDLHIWLKRGRALEQQAGNSRHHRRRLAAHLIDGEQAP